MADNDEQQHFPNEADAEGEPLPNLRSGELEQRNRPSSDAVEGASGSDLQPSADTVSPSETPIEPLENITGETLIQLLASENYSWRGLLPPPEHFKQYSPQVQGKMVAWNDARILDESKRLDKLTDAQIENSKNLTGWAVFLTILFTIMAAIAGFKYENTVLAALFLGVPALSTVVSMINSARIGGKEPPKPQER
ncbi:hypothetical protein [Varibaculum massiliense]|uniref:hypothetical protein n=1 Tax=Varibaculum massiliense TaxID=1852372 RepID=UPI0008DAF356|nr:hypothetical protein [Varibaculum massiliense]